MSDFWGTQIDGFLPGGNRSVRDVTRLINLCEISVRANVAVKNRSKEVARKTSVEIQITHTASVGVVLVNNKYLWMKIGGCNFCFVG